MKDQSDARMKGGTVSVELSIPTAKALALGLKLLATTGTISRRRRYFFSQFASRLDKVADEGIAGTYIPLAGEGVFFEESEQQYSVPRLPAVYRGRWHKTGRTVIAGTVWEFVEQCKKSGLRLPPGSIDFLTVALDASATYQLNGEDVTLSATRRSR